MPLDPFGVLYTSRTEYWSEERRARVLLRFVEQLIARLDDGFEFDDFLVLFDACSRDTNVEMGPFATEIVERTKDIDDGQRAASLFCFLQLISWKITDQDLMTPELFKTMLDNWLRETDDVVRDVMHLSSLKVS